MGGCFGKVKKTLEGLAPYDDVSIRKERLKRLAVVTQIVVLIALLLFFIVFDIANPVEIRTVNDLKNMPLPPMDFCMDSVGNKVVAAYIGKQTSDKKGNPTPTSSSTCVSPWAKEAFAGDLVDENCPASIKVTANCLKFSVSDNWALASKKITFFVSMSYYSKNDPPPATPPNTDSEEHVGTPPQVDTGDNNEEEQPTSLDLDSLIDVIIYNPDGIDVQYIGSTAINTVRLSSSAEIDKHGKKSVSYDVTVSSVEPSPADKLLYFNDGNFRQAAIIISAETMRQEQVAKETSVGLVKRILTDWLGLVGAVGTFTAIVFGIILTKLLFTKEDAIEHDLREAILHLTNSKMKEMNVVASEGKGKSDGTYV